MSVEENVWAASDADPAPPGTEAAGDGPHPGGELPEVIPLLTETFQDLIAHWQGYLLAGLGFLVVMLPIALVLAVAPVVGLIPGALAGDETMMILGMYAGLGVMLLLMPVVWAVGVLFQASMYRAAWYHEVEGEDLGFGSVFSRMKADIVPMELAFFAIMTLTLIGALMCYLPGLVVGLATIFVLPAIAVHRMGVVDAFKLSVGHAREHFVWHLAFWGLTLVVMMIAGYIPIVGNLFAIPFYYVFTMKAYRRIFGEGETPYGWEG